MRSTLICVDFDDTLVANQAHFEAAQARLAGLLSSETAAEPAEVHRVFALVDAELAAHGRHRHRFLLSVVGTYCRVAGLDAVPLRLVPQLADIAALPYDAPPVPAPGVLQALQRLRAGYRGALWLVTAGDRVVQEGRLRRSGLTAYFDGAHVVPEKTADVFRALGQGQRDPWMIGNAPASDILPALAAGFRTVHVAVPTWQFDLAPLPPGVPSVPDFPAAVALLLAQS